MPPKKKKETVTKAKELNLAKEEKQSPAPTRSTANTFSIFAAVIAFFLGVISPPTLHLFNTHVDTLDLKNKSSSSSKKASSGRLLPPFTPCTATNLANYVHDVPIPGLHIVCIEAVKFDADGKTAPSLNYNDDQQRRLLENNSLRFTFLKESIKTPKLYQRKYVNGRDGGGGSGVGSVDWNDVKQLLIRELQLAPEGPRQQPWAVFTPLGQRIVGEKDVVSKTSSSVDDGNNNMIGSNEHILQMLASSGMVLVFQGGNWGWPGVREGFQRSIDLSPTLNFNDESNETRKVTIETLSMTPLVVSIKGFLTDEECEHIATTAEPHMEYSGVSLKDVDKGKAASNWRTSQSTFLSSRGDNILNAIDHRTASLSRVPKNHQEMVQVLRYVQTEKYDAHHDYFDPKDYQRDPQTLSLIENGKKNRFATVFWYLTTVKEGGETIFPHYQGKPLPPGYRHSDCTYGLKVKPQKGKVIIFYSLDARGQQDPMSLHGACPVIGEQDVKWAANKWIWNGQMGYTSAD